jgi:hypothetical protein
MRNLVSGTLSFGHKQRGQFCHCIDVRYFIRHEALSNGGIGVFQYAATAEQVTMWLPATARNDQIKRPLIPSLEFVPNTTPAALLIQMTVLDQVAEMLLQRVSADTRQFDRIANRDAPVLAGKFNDLQ